MSTLAQYEKKLVGHVGQLDSGTVGQLDHGEE